MTDFVHLKVHTDRSLLKSMIPGKKLVDVVVEQNMPAVGIADHMNMFSIIPFYEKCLANGVKPITATEIRLKDGDRVGNMTLIASNNAGYKNIMKILSVAYEEGFDTEKDDLPGVSRKMVEDHNEGIIALTGGRFGPLGQGIMERDREVVLNELKWLRKTFGRENVYIELQRTGLEKDEDHLHMAAELAARNGYYVVATNPVCFLSHEDFRIHNIRCAINEKATVDNFQRETADIYTPHMYLKTAEEMTELFSDIPEAIENTTNIARRCNVEIDLGNFYLPQFPVPEGQTEALFLQEESEKGLQKRLEFEFGENNPELDEIRKEYDKRLAFELDVINTMGFPGYFLIVSDFIRWAKDNRIAVGPGRGSGAGSLVAYSLGITDLNPLKYDLLFERFLNPERVSMPDFDVDFCMVDRDRVIKYVADKYGHKAVSQIVTYGTLGAKAVVRDVARTLGYSAGVGNRISKMIPGDPGVKLRGALEDNPTFQLVYDEDPEVREIIDISLRLEGMARQTGKHAGGVLIAPGELSDFTPTYNDPKGNGFVSQYDKSDVETAGLVKFDFLGLRTLTIIQNAINAINDKRSLEKGEDAALIDINAIPLDDMPVLEMYQRGDTSAVFQVESRGMKELLKTMKPDCFEDLIALVALFRPGPLQSGMVENFVNRKHGREEISYPDPTYQHELLKPILEPTYGIILYQEQVMQIAQELAGYTLGQADLLRRAMGKKKPEEMAKQRGAFAEGAKNQGIDPTLAMKIFDLVEKFAGYGFNKSHSAAYALISYQTGWLKHHYPAEYMASVLSSDMNETDKVVGFIDEARRIGLEVKAPCINESRAHFVAPDDKSIVYGLGAIKWVGEAFLVGMIKDRDENGPYKNVLDFLRRTNPDIRLVTNLIDAGAFDSFGFNRATLKHNMQMIKDFIKKEKDKGKKKNPTPDLFSTGEITDITEIPGFKVFDDDAPLKVLQGERTSMGIFLSGHPLDSIQADIANICEHKLVDLLDSSLDSQQQADENNVEDKVRERVTGVTTIAGVIMDFEVKTYSKGKQTAIVKIDDGTGQVNVVVNDKAFNEFQHLLKKDEVIQITGKVQTNKKSGAQKFIANDVKDIMMIRESNFSGLVIDLEKVDMTDALQESLNRLMKEEPRGHCRVYIKTSVQGKVRQMPLGSNKIGMTNEFIHRVRKLFGEDTVSLMERNTKTMDKGQSSLKADIKEHGRITAEERRQKRARYFDELESAMSM